MAIDSEMSDRYWEEREQREKDNRKVQADQIREHWDRVEMPLMGMVTSYVLIGIEQAMEEFSHDTASDYMYELAAGAKVEEMVEAAGFHPEDGLESAIRAMLEAVAVHLRAIEEFKA